MGVFRCVQCQQTYYCKRFFWEDDQAPDDVSAPCNDTNASCRVCENGHALADASSFCLQCGSPPRQEDPSCKMETGACYDEGDSFNTQRHLLESCLIPEPPRSATPNAGSNASKDVLPGIAQGELVQSHGAIPMERKVSSVDKDDRLSFVYCDNDEDAHSDTTSSTSLRDSTTSSSPCEALSDQDTEASLWSPRWSARRDSTDSTAVTGYARGADVARATGTASNVLGSIVPVLHGPLGPLSAIGGAVGAISGAVQLKEGLSSPSGVVDPHLVAKGSITTTVGTTCMVLGAAAIANPALFLPALILGACGLSAATTVDATMDGLCEECRQGNCHDTHEAQTIGTHIVVTDSLLVTESRDFGSATVAPLAEGSTIEVVEIAEEPVQSRIRARIASPAGWITAGMADGSVKFVQASQEKPAAPNRDARRRRSQETRLYHCDEVRQAKPAAPVVQEKTLFFPIGDASDVEHFNITDAESCNEAEEDDTFIQV